MFNKSLRTSIIVGVIILKGVSINASKIDNSQVLNGIVKINHKSNTSVAVRIKKGNQKRDFLLQENDFVPLQFGEGEYDVWLLEGVDGTKYKKIESQKVTYKPANKNSIYLQSFQGMTWNKDMEAMKLARELTKNAKHNEEKVRIIYNYITDNIEYDYDKVKTVKPGYAPDIDTILTSGKGICCDYSVLFSAMLRSLNIPTRVVEGYKNDIKEFHAWNEVLINGEWETIDTTYDAGLKLKNMIKNKKDYKVSNFY